MTAEPPPFTHEEPRLVEYRPTAAIMEFLTDPSFVRVLVGGRGSSKTYGGVCMDLVNHCWHVAGAKCNIVRLTEASQKDSTIDTFHKFFATLGPLYRENGLLFKTWNGGRTFRLPSRKAVEALQEAKERLTNRAEIATWIATEGARLCGTIEMRGIPNNASAQSKFRGMECSRMVFVEADQMKRSDFNLSFACLRWGGADPDTCDEQGFIVDQGIIVDTNPPSPSHWIAEMEREEMEKAPEDREMRFWHLKTDDNQHNLPPDYIEKQIMLPYANNPAMIERMRYGRYADAYEGKPVFYAYDRARHEGEDLPWPKGAYLVRGWDFGTHNAVVWSAYWIENGVEYWHDLSEQYLEGSDTDRQAEAAIAHTEREFPFWNDREQCAGILDYCDPAGVNSAYTRQIKVNLNGKDATVADSSVNILRTHGIYPGMRTTARGVQETITIVNRLLQKRDAKGRYVYRVDTNGCPRLVRGLRGGYRYPAKGESGEGGNEPLKGEACDHLDHQQDAARYAKINCLRLLQEEMKAKPPAFAARKAASINPRRRI